MPAHFSSGRPGRSSASKALRKFYVLTQRKQRAHLNLRGLVPSARKLMAEMRAADDDHSLALQRPHFRGRLIAVRARLEAARRNFRAMKKYGPSSQAQQRLEAMVEELIESFNALESGLALAGRGS